jgi:hypothetical protein
MISKNSEPGHALHLGNSGKSDLGFNIFSGYGQTFRIKPKALSSLKVDPMFGLIGLAFLGIELKIHRKNMRG